MVTRIKYLTQDEYNYTVEFKSLKDVYNNFRKYRPKYYWMRKNSPGFTKWKHVQKAYKDVNKANYRPDTLYFVMNDNY